MINRLQQLAVFALLLLAAFGSYWLMNQLLEEESKLDVGVFEDPDYYMEDFNTLSMREDGTPKNKLYAVYMAHYEKDDTSELLQPLMEIYRIDNTPLYIKAEKGWVTSGSEVVLLRGKVRMWENNEQGQRTMQVDTTNARVLMDAEYAESDEFTTIVSNKSTITGTGMRAFFKTSKLEVIDHERTIIEQGSDIIRQFI